MDAERRRGARLTHGSYGSAARRVVTALEHMLACDFDGGKVSQFFLRPANEKAGYMAGALAGEAPTGDSIEIVEVVRGSRARPGGRSIR